MKYLSPFYNIEKQHVEVDKKYRFKLKIKMFADEQALLQSRPLEG